MTDEPGLIRSILGAPDDDTPRLAYADWLDEHGQPERAELIRVQCRVAGGRAEPGDEGRATELLNAVHGEPGEFRASNYTRWFDGSVVNAAVFRPVFRRGLVAEVRPTLANWQTHAAELLAAHPLEQVDVSDVPGLEFVVMRFESGSWGLHGRFPDGGIAAYHTITFPTRPALVAGAAAAVSKIVDGLRDAAGERWPGQQPVNPEEPRATIRFEYVVQELDTRAMEGQTGRVNADTFLGFPPGSLRFLGSEARQTESGWRVVGEIAEAPTAGVPARPAAALMVFGATLFRDLIPPWATVVAPSRDGVHFTATADVFEMAYRIMQLFAESIGEVITTMAHTIREHFALLAATLPTSYASAPDPAAQDAAAPAPRTERRRNSRQHRIPPTRTRFPHP